MSDMCGVEPLSFSAFGRSSFSATSFSLSFPICPFCLSSKGELQSFDSQQKALSAVTFLLRVRSAARAEKCKWEVAGEGVYLSTVVGLASSSSALHVTFAHISPIRSRKIPETTQRADREERR